MILESKEPLERLAIVHSNADNRSMSHLKTLLTPYTQSLNVPLVNIGSVFASHVGPGCLGVAFVRVSNHDINFPPEGRV